MSARNVVWWGIFFIVGIWLQLAIPGIDVLAAGLLLTLQERKFSQTIVILILLILIQEGTGTLHFGAGILWYFFLVVFFFLGRWIFATENMLFMVLFGMGSGVTHYVIIHIMLVLQKHSMDTRLLQDESILQALLLPIAWKLAQLLRPLSRSHEETV